MAGESAREVARRRRERGKRLLAQAEAFERGAEGEEATAAALAMLPPAQWTVFHDVRWPGRRLANIDHIAVGPGGVFVIDSKNWQGRVEVRDGVLRQNGFRREREVASAADAALAVAGLVRGLDPRLVHPVICLVGQPPVAAYAREVLLCSTANVAIALQTHQAVLDARGVRSTVGWLHLALRAAGGTPPPKRAPRIPAAVRPVAAPVRKPRRVGAAANRIVLMLLAMLGLLLLAGVVAGAARSVLTHLPASGASRHHAVVGALPQLGRTAHLPRATNRPPLSITVDKVRTVTSKGEVSPYLFPGNRWVGARVVIHNDGKRTWHSEPGTRWTFVDDLGVDHEAGGDIHLAAGRTLGPALKVAPGQTVRGWVVSQMRLQTPVVRATITVGPGAPATASWAVDRQ